ncbi:PREDICTED: uncharacterized protein LOC104732613 [Camelina sativa]|uniref:Uncharacterized protein LOC104732613 n=1 Tax=Camelina sativa TaxID=90675 RepID=A0ABM0V449_CAMSA|nr:PREDICTED: uncharacterized protein LOC104732613 [Camelina sativa]
MANREDTSSAEIRCVFVETNLDTCLALPVHKDEIISDFKDKLRKEHKQAFPKIGEINVSALKVKRRRKFYHFSESMNVFKAFDGISTDWFMYVDAVRVEKDEVLTIMAADDNRSNLELVEKEKEIANDGSVLVDVVHSKALVLYQGLETEVVERKTRKRKITSSDGITSRKKSKVDLIQSPVDTAELCGRVQVDVASHSCLVSPREKLDGILMGTDIESGETNGVSMGENQQTSDADRLLEEKILTVNSELLDGHTRGEMEDVPDNQTVKEALEKLDDLTGEMEQDTEKRGEIADIVMIDQEKDLPPPSEIVDGQITSQDDERGEGSRLTPSAINNLQTAENQLEVSSSLTTGPATEKKRKRTKSSKDHINQSTAAVTTTSRTIVNEITSERETLGNPLLEAVEKETGMVEKSVEDVGREKIKADNIASHQESHLEANSGLTTSPVPEKKKKLKKSSKDHINKSTATSESISISRGEKPADTLVDAIQNENEMGDKFVNKVGSREATSIDADKIQDANNLEVASMMSTPTALVHESKTLDHIPKFTDESTSHEHEVSMEKGEIDADKAKSVKSTKKKSSKKVKTPAKEDTLVDSGAQNVEPVKDGEGAENVIRNVLDSLQQRNEVEENLTKSEKKSSKRSKKKDSWNLVEEVEVVESLQQKNEAAENLAISGKKSSKRSKKKDSWNIVEEVEVVESLQQKNEAAENLAISGKKSNKRSKKKDSLNTVEVEAQVLSVEVNDASQVEASPINNLEDTDASFTPAKKNTEINASHLNKIVQVDDTNEDINRSMQTLIENVDMGDNFGSSQKDNIVGGGNKKDQVAGRTKSKKEKKSLDGSIDGAMRKKGAVNKKKEVVEKCSTLATVNKSKKNVNNKKEVVKKSSNSVTAKKTNFFKDAEMSEDESKTTSHDSTKTPSINSSDNDSDVTSSMFRKQGNNLVGGTNMFSGSLQDILRSSKSYKVAKLTASQSQPEEFVDFVPDSQFN